MNKKKVAIIFGGKSAEHEVSVQSAKNIHAALDKAKYDITVIGIDKEGRWYISSGEQLLHIQNSLPNMQKADTVSLVSKGNTSHIVSTTTQEDLGSIDVILPILHGPYGEDGSMQGFLELLNVPFVGSGVLGSAIGMDKDVSKRLLRDAGLPIGKFLTFTNPKNINFEKIHKDLGLPMFIKPANMGSSIGVAKVTSEETFHTAIKNAFSYDTKILIEAYIAGVEIECSVLGNDDPIASVPGAIIAKKDFYSYDAKYVDENGAELHIPADLPKEKITEVQNLAKKTFMTLCLEGMARVDFFYTKDEKFYVNEVNTIPGFTNISMYPKLWEASGIHNTQLVDRLIELAIEKFEKRKKLSTSV